MASDEAPSLDPTAKPFVIGKGVPKFAFRPSGSPSISRDVSHSTPARQLRQTSLTGSVGMDTFTTADGSPLLPRRTASPMSRSVIPSSSLTGGRLSFSRRSTPEHSFSNDYVELDVGFEHSIVFSRPAIKVDPAADDRRFREWTFPTPGSPPSISRRHSLPFKALPGDNAFPEVASTTFAERVDGLRQLLGRSAEAEGQNDEDGRVFQDSTQASVEFPMRTEKKRLAVVNNTPALLSPSRDPENTSRPESPSVDKLDVMFRMLERCEALLAAAEEKRVEGIDNDGMMREIREEVAGVREAVNARPGGCLRRAVMQEADGQQ